MNKEEKELELLKEKLAYYKELLKNLTILLIPLVGGTAGLLFKLNNPISVMLVVPGIILTVGVITGILSVLGSLKKLMKELEEWGRR